MPTGVCCWATPTPHPAVEPCHRCGAPAELPAVGSGSVAGQAEDHSPLCADCLELLLADPEAFWKPLRQRRDGG
jgi:hypothetical protein